MLLRSSGQIASRKQPEWYKTHSFRFGAFPTLAAELTISSVYNTIVTGTNIMSLLLGIEIKLRIGLRSVDLPFVSCGLSLLRRFPA